MGTIAVPNTFSPNTTISSSQVNSNFSTIYNEFNGNIAAANLATGAVTTAKIADSNVTTAKIADSNVTTAKIADGAVTAPKIDWASTGANAGIWWEEIGRTTLSGAGDTITVSSIAARKYLKVIVHVLDTGGTITATIRFNNNSGNNYAYRRLTNGADATSTSQSSITIAPDAVALDQYAVVDIINVATAVKMVISNSMSEGTAGAANAPSQRLITGKWVNTADQITRIDVVNTGTGDFAIGSEVVVLGHN